MRNCFFSKLMMRPPGLNISEEGEQKRFALPFTFSRGGRKDYGQDFDVSEEDKMILYLSLFSM